MVTKPAYRKILVILAALLGWLALMCSPIGNIVAAITILVLIVLLFVIGCISVHQTPDKF